MNGKKNNKNTKKFCKICQDAGKSELEYTSHYSRETPDPKSKVVCPTLIAQDCRYCFKKGHTVKYCPTIKQNEKYKRRNEAFDKYNQQKISATESKGKTKETAKNIFAALCDDEESDSSDEKEEFPTITEQVAIPEQAPAATISRNYAEVAAKMPEIETPVAKADPVPIQKKAQETYRSKWAALESDDEEDDYEEEDDDAYLQRCDDSYSEEVVAQVGDDDW
jgi:hypothetical protein